MFCKYCGKKIDNDSKFCKYCGGDLTKSKIEIDDTPYLKKSSNIKQTKDSQITESIKRQKLLLLISLFAFFITFTGLLVALFLLK